MFGWTIDDLCGKSRRRPLVTARQIGMYVFRELTDYSYPKIAEEFGGRDHTTVMHACEKIRGQMAETPRRVRAGQRPHQPHQARRQWIRLWTTGDIARRDQGQRALAAPAEASGLGNLWTSEWAIPDRRCTRDDAGCPQSTAPTTTKTRNYNISASRRPR